jgi:hypothetical protein
MKDTRKRALRVLRMMAGASELQLMVYRCHLIDAVDLPQE